MLPLVGCYLRLRAGSRGSTTYQHLSLSQSPSGSFHPGGILCAERFLLGSIPLRFPPFPLPCQLAYAPPVTPLVVFWAFAVAVLFPFCFVSGLFGFGLWLSGGARVGGGAAVCSGLVLLLAGWVGFGSAWVGLGLVGLGVWCACAARFGRSVPAPVAAVVAGLGAAAAVRVRASVLPAVAAARPAVGAVVSVGRFVAAPGAAAAVGVVASVSPALALALVAPVVSAPSVVVSAPVAVPVVLPVVVPSVVAPAAVVAGPSCPLPVWFGWSCSLAVRAAVPVPGSCCLSRGRVSRSGVAARLSSSALAGRVRRLRRLGVLLPA